MSKKRESGLTDQQERFCQEYLKDLNATQAAKRAGYSDKTAQEQSSRLLSNVMVQQRVQDLMDDRSKRTSITADKVLNELAEIAFMSLSADGLISEAKKLLDEGFDPRSLTKAGYPDKLKALELLGKHLKLFTDRHEHSGRDGGAIQFSDNDAAAKMAAILNAVKSRKESSESEH